MTRRKDNRRARARDFAARRPLGDTIIARCSSCNAELMKRAFIKGGAVRIGPDEYLCNECEGGG